PPAHIVIAWDDATIGGFAATQTLSEPVRRELDARIRRLWPPGPYALAAAAAKAIKTMAGRSRRAVVCFIAPDRSAGGGRGERARTGALPVSLGSGGVEEVRLPTLSAIERVALENAMML